MTKVLPLTPFRALFSTFTVRLRDQTGAHQTVDVFIIRRNLLKHTTMLLRQLPQKANIDRG